MHLTPPECNSALLKDGVHVSNESPGCYLIESPHAPRRCRTRRFARPTGRTRVPIESSKSHTRVGVGVDRPMPDASLDRGLLRRTGWKHSTVDSRSMGQTLGHQGSRCAPESPLEGSSRLSPPAGLPGASPTANALVSSSLRSIPTSRTSSPRTKRRMES